MAIKIYNTLCTYDSLEAFNKECYHRLTSYHWEADVPYRPKTYCKIGLIGNSIVAYLKSYEEKPRAIYENRDDPIYKDSCLEFFIKPLEKFSEYINVECNSKGAFLCEIGEGKHDRRLLAIVSKLSPLVEAFFGEDANGSYWGVKIEITEELLKDAFKVADVNYSVVECNFYKCGDNCETPHYLAFSPVTKLPPGFHNPECFAKFKKI